MSETVSVSISAIAFSFISYENVKFNTNQEGFLLGDLISKETNHVTDAEHRVVNKQKIIKIRSVIPCPHQFYFYDSSGKIDKLKIKGLLDNHQDKVVGWYIFKHKQSHQLKLTLREKIIHKQLAELLQSPISYFTSCLLTQKNSNTNATYLFSQTFLRYHMCKYDILPLHITNLGKPNYEFEFSQSNPDILVDVVNKIQHTEKVEGHLFIQKIHDGLQSYMKNLVEKSMEKEQQLFKLEQEIKQLKQNLTMSSQYKNIFKEKDDRENSMSIEKTIVSEETIETTKKRRGRPKKALSPPQNKYPTRNSTNVYENSIDNTKEVLQTSTKKKTKLNSTTEKK
ncbi:hypothetical protein FQA39_LY12769 [Lamprigera yunnana]|nr:hypothetical protein FQA39_LY12769 [Lamprigera yunnana]